MFGLGDFGRSKMDAGFGCRDVGNVARVSARIGLRDIGYIDPEVGFGLRVTGID
jgi:hypothetical protein